MSRGYFEIGCWMPKTTTNVGTLWRSAYQLGACGIFTVGQRYKYQASDTIKASRHVPLRTFMTFEEWEQQRPHAAELVGIEMGGHDLRTFKHPQSAVYLLGAEDHGLPPKILAKCTRVVSIPSIRTNSFNMAVAGSLVMFDRLSKGADR